MRSWNYERLGTTLHCAPTTYGWHTTPASCLWNIKDINIYHFHGSVSYIMTLLYGLWPSRWVRDIMVALHLHLQSRFLEIL
jgi:hypothetical protein